MTKTDIIRKNIDYLLKVNNESKISLSDGSGVNRTTIYNILEGKVVKVQENTLRKVAFFFGVSFYEIQSVDLTERDHANSNVSVDGNMNPIAVPIINDTTILSSMNAKIGRMIVTAPVTYYFGEGPNVIAVLLTRGIEGYYNKGDTVIVRRWDKVNRGNVLVLSPQKKLRVVERGKHPSVSDEIIGTIIEERYGSQ
jgi:transcriptional regulator with XRE-family HTH domain